MAFRRAALRLGAAACVGGGAVAFSPHPSYFDPTGTYDTSRVLPVARADASGGMNTPNSETSNDPREKLVILGSGWGAVALVKNIDPNLYDVSVVSPRNFFLNTPLLPGVTVGTVEARSLIEPVRRLLPGKPGQSRFYEAAANAVDVRAKTVTCVDESEIKAANPGFTLSYDKLVVAIGAPPNTFNTPGVRRGVVNFLKEIDDARDVRRKLADLFETASLPGVSEEEQRRMLSVVVVGGGPTGVEFAAELHDFLRDDVPKLYPGLAEKARITVVQSADHILNTYDARISEYAESKFARDGIELVTNARVTEVRPNEASVMDKKTKKVTKIPFGVCVWSTGLGTHALARELKRQAGQNMRRRAIAVDKYLQVRGVRRTTGKPEMRGTVYALGDCADVKSKAATGTELLDRADELFALADADGNGTVDKDEFRAVMKSLEDKYPHLATFTKGGSDSRLTDIMDKFDVSKDAALNRTEFRAAMEEADALLTSHPSTAQVANQQGEFLARELNAQARAKKNGETVVYRPFEYTHLGSFANLGANKAALDLPGDFVSKGYGTMLLWYGVYFSNCVSWRNKFLVVGDWFKKSFWGRDSSRV